MALNLDDGCRLVTKYADDQIFSSETARKSDAVIVNTKRNECRYVQLYNDKL